MHVGNRLADCYGDVVNEEIPRRFTDLLRRFAAQAERDLKKSGPKR